MSNPDVDNLMALLHKAMYKAVEDTFGKFVTSDGKLALRTAPVQGPLPKGGGGTGTTHGFADHGHSGGTDGQQLDEANTHGALDVDPATMIHWTREQLQDMIAGGFLFAGDGISLDYDDETNVLTISGSAAATTRWEPLTNGDPDFPELIYEDGDVLMEEVPL
jgi:hypothetical protein